MIDDKSGKIYDRRNAELGGGHLLKDLIPHCFEMAPEVNVDATKHLHVHL